VLTEPLYGRPPGAREPMLLLAAGHRIESARQLRLLRDAGYLVLFPTEAIPGPEPVDREAAASPPAALPAPAAAFATGVQAAESVREAITSAVRQLMEAARAGTAPDVEVLEEVSAALVADTASAPYAVSALTYLRQCDDYTVEHSADVAILMCGIARVLGVPDPELRTLALAGLMHDVGKQRVPREILMKPAR